MSAPTSGKWSLSREALERLLQSLHADPVAASREYEEVHQKLVDFFDWRGAASPEVLADETLDRVARKLQDGAQIEKIYGYIHAVARHVALESGRRRARELSVLNELSRGTGTDSPDEEADRRLQCLKRCLARLPADSQALITAYYEGEGRTYLAERKGLAQKLGISYSSLKSRAHRVRNTLEACLTRCLDGKEDDR